MNSCICIDSMRATEGTDRSGVKKEKQGNPAGMFLFLCFLGLLCLMPAFPAHAALRPAVYRKAAVSRKRSDIIIYVGDSRTMYYAIHGVKEDRDCLIYQDGAAIGALRYNRSYGKCSTLAKYLRTALKTYPNAKVVFNMGCNGNGRRSRNGKALVREYRKWIRAYPKRSFYIASVFPAAEKRGSYTRKNMHYINRVLKKAFPDRYIDAGEYLERRGLDQPRPDGRGFQKRGGGYDFKHYSAYASRAVKNYMRRTAESESIS